MAQNETVNVLEQMPAGGGVNRPSSGTYGEKAAQERLESALPSPNAQPEPTPEAQMSLPNLPSAPPVPTPGDIPAPLLAPTNNPATPITTPLQDYSSQVGTTPSEKNIIILESMSKDPQVSAETREWAATVLQGLLRRGAKQ